MLQIVTAGSSFVSLLILSFLPAVGAPAQVNSARGVRTTPPLRTSGNAAAPSHRPSDLSTSSPSFGETVVHTAGSVWNPTPNREDRVRLRSYRGDALNRKAPFVSPTGEVSPGDAGRITLNNRRPGDPACTSSTYLNIPHCFKGTNLPAHGLWVNPRGNGDCVLISINPGVSFRYEYRIPPGHPAGTFWNHTHGHNSTALQVSSGIAGGLLTPATDGVRRSGELS